jgi:hypothetical protein
VSMGLRGQDSHPAVQENLLRVLAACKEFGVPCATGAQVTPTAAVASWTIEFFPLARPRESPGLPPPGFSFVVDKS